MIKPSKALKQAKRIHSGKDRTEEDELLGDRTDLRQYPLRDLQSTSQDKRLFSGYIKGPFKYMMIGGVGIGTLHGAGPSRYVSNSLYTLSVMAVEESVRLGSIFPVEEFSDFVRSADAAIENKHDSLKPIDSRLIIAEGFIPDGTRTAKFSAFVANIEKKRFRYYADLAVYGRLHIGRGDEILGLEEMHKTPDITTAQALDSESGNKLQDIISRTRHDLESLLMPFRPTFTNINWYLMVDNVTTYR
jgi:hypothetical protein